MSHCAFTSAPIISEFELVNFGYKDIEEFLLNSLSQRPGTSKNKNAMKKSKVKRKRNVIESDEESDNETTNEGYGAEESEDSQLPPVSQKRQSRKRNGKKKRIVPEEFAEVD